MVIEDRRNGIAGASEGKKVLLFKADGRVYGLKIDTVIKVVEEERITYLPRMGSRVAGVMLYEGKALPVFYIAKPRRARKKSELVLVAQQGKELLGVIIDSVLRIVASDDEKVKEGMETGGLEGMPFKMITPADIIPSGQMRPRGGGNG